MPSFQWFKPFSKKNKGHVNKYHDYHGYDNLRHQAGAQYTATPPMMGPQQTHQNHYHNNNNTNTNINNSSNSNNQYFNNQYHQPPPHSLSHRQHQINPQQLFMQSIPSPTQQPQPQQQLQQQQSQNIQHPQQQQMMMLIPPPGTSLSQPHQIQAPILNTPSLVSLGPSQLTQNQQLLNQQQQQILQHQPHNHHQHHTAQCQQCSPLQQSPQTHMAPVQMATNNIPQQSPPQVQVVNQSQMPSINNSTHAMSAQQQHPPIQPLQAAATTTMHPTQLQHQQCHLQQPASIQCSSHYVNNQMISYNNLQQQQPHMPQTPAQVVTSPQCTCQSCPYQQQLQSQQQQQQQQQQLVSSPQQYIQQVDQILFPNGSCFRHQAPSIDSQSNGNTIEHLHNHTMQPQHNSSTTTTASITANHICPITHMTQQQISMPMIMNSSTPGLQHHQTPTAQQQQQQQHQQQQQPQQQLQQPMQNSMGTTSIQQYKQYHTIQPNVYQQQKQQQMQHHRGHSQLAQVISTHEHESLTQQHVIYQDAHLSAQSFSLQLQQQQEQQCREDDAKLQDCSRYANIQSFCMNGPSPTTKVAAKYQEPLYCNQKRDWPPLYSNQKRDLPPYEAPPTYEHFIANRRMYAIEMSGQQHTTHLSESMLQRAKDSSYENLRLRGQTYHEGFTS